MLYLQNKLCIFIHFSKRNCIPYNVQVYVNELACHFDDVRVLTNKRDIDEIANFKANVRLHFEKNEGYDFGMLYKFTRKQILDKYSEIAIINDSNILLKELKDIFAIGRKQTSDFWGLIDSNEKPWFSNHISNYHIQSHFIVLNQKAIKALESFIRKFDAKSVFEESNQKKLRRLVIDQWEIGFSQFLIKKGLQPFAHICSKKDSLKNLAHSDALGIISKGYPLLKKKVYYEASSKSKKKWDNLITATVPKKWNGHSIIEELDTNRKLVKKPFLKRLLRF